MSEFRGRGRGRGGRGRGGPRGGGRGGYMSDRDGGRGRGGFSRGRGDGFSRGRGGPPPRHMSRDDSPPPRKMQMMSRSYDGSDRGRGPPLSSRRMDRYDDSYDRGPPRSRDSYSPPPRDSSRLLDRLTPPRSSLRDRDYGMGSRGDYPSSRSDFLSQRHYSPPRDSGSYRDSYGSSHREDRRDSFTRPPREYRGSHDYPSERSRDFRDSGRDYRDSGRDYHPSSRDSGFRDGPSRREFRDPPMSDRTPPRSFSRGGRGPPPRGSFSDSRRSYSDDEERDFDSRDSGRFSSRFDDSGPSRGPPHREYRGRGGMRGGMRGRDDRGGGRGFMNGSRGRGPPRGRGRPDFAGGRRSSPSSRDALLGKRPRMEGSDGYSSRR